jgi:hypothetical protein
VNELVEVAVLPEDGRSSAVALWQRWASSLREDGQRAAYVMIYGGGGAGQRSAVVPESRVLRLRVCGRVPSGEIAHSDECRAEVAS